MTSVSFTSALRTVLTRGALARLALGWGAFVLLLLAGPLLSDPAGLSTLTLFTVLLAIIGVIVVCAFGVVTQAEHLAHRLGDPYGTLVLTLSIVLIEVILISAVMLGPGDHATIARDSVMAVSMIILNLVVGVALLVGASRRENLQANNTGVSAYLSLLVVLGTVAFLLPELIGDEGAYTTGQAVPVAVLTVLLYIYFLYRQMGPQRRDFQEVDLAHPSGRAPGDDGADSTSMSAVLRTHRAEIISRVAVLVLTVIPIVLLSHDMAALLDIGLDRMGAPVALSGVLIAMIVFLPETITTIRAAWGGEMQRVSNLCHGALVSTVGLTIPSVLIIGMLTGQTVTLGDDPTGLALFGVTLLLTLTSFTGKKLSALHGAAHVLLFVLYAITLFA